MEHGGLMRLRRGIPLFWKVCLINGVMFAAAATVLVVSPATVSSRVTPQELILLGVGVVAIMVANAALLRRELMPLDRLARELDTVDVTDIGWRLPLPPGRGVEWSFVTAFNTLLDRLSAERLASESKARAAEEAERRRIARELHDEVGQRLTVVLLSVSRLLGQVPGQHREELVLVQENTRETLSLVRRLAEGLREGLLEDMDLLGSLTSLATTFGASSRLHVSRRFDRSVTEVDPEVHTALFRVAQESLTNVARHADADAVVLELRQHTEAGHRCLVLTVADDGRGYRPGSAGFGIAGMRERARAVGGTLTVGPRADGGTEVRLTVPSGATP